MPQTPAFLLLAALAAAPATSAPVMNPAPGAIMEPAAPALPPLPTLTFAASADEARLELPLPLGTSIEERATASEWRFVVPGWSPPQDFVGFTDPVLGQLTLKADERGTTFVLPWKHWCPTSIQWIDGDRLSVTIRKVFTVAVAEDLAPGVRHEHRRSADAAGPLDVHVLRVDPRAPGVRIAPALAKDTFFGREPVSAIARRAGGVAAINGSYFSPRTGEPLGLLMIDGELVAGPLYNRTALALGGTESEIGRTQLATRLTLPAGESYDFDGVNQPRGLNRMVLYTSRFGASTFTSAETKGATEYVLLPDGTVLGTAPGNASIPPGGMVVSAQGQAADWLAKRVHIGDRLSVRSALAELWPGVKHVLGGGPALLDDGQVRITAEQEQFRPDITNGRAPRTAVGIDAEQRLLLVTVDGRQPRRSVGLSLKGLAGLMRELGARDALNLDGGGSTAMAIGPATVNSPSDGSERPVNNALVVWSKASLTSATR